VEKWREVLDKHDPIDALAQIYDFTDALDDHLPRTKKPSDGELRLAIQQAEAHPTSQLAASKLGFGGRVLISHLLGGICYPSRVMLAHRMTRITFGEKLRSWMNRLAWLFRFGSVKLLFVEAPVRVRRIDAVSGFLRSSTGRLVGEYLREILERRQGMQKQTYLSRVITDMALMTTLISHYARAAASAERLHEVEPRHVKEGIGIAELLFSHQGDAGQSVVLHQLRLNLMSNREDFRRLLAAEI
jgi:hypothetical protein